MLLLGNLRRGLHPKLVALHRPRSLGVLVSRKLKAGGAPSQRSLQPRKRRPRPFWRQEKMSSRRNPHRSLLKPRPSREELLRESPKHQRWKGWAKGGPSDPRPQSHPPRRPRTQRRRRGAGPSDQSLKSHPMRSLQLKSQRPKVGPGGPSPRSHRLKSLQSKKWQRAASSPFGSPREGKTEPRERLHGLKTQQSAALFQCSLSFYHCFLPF